MCLIKSRVAPINKWNWDGDLIINNPVIPNSRLLPQSKKKIDLDVREFLNFGADAVVLGELAAYISKLPVAERDFFHSRKPGSFDFRFLKVTDFVKSRIKYDRKVNRKFDAWYFPFETLAYGKGDCEDISILIGALLLASGISGYCVRVALGKVFVSDSSDYQDHAWIMYKTESGSWVLVEPLCFTKHNADARARSGNRPDGKNVSKKYEYIPFYLFNDKHLWRVNHEKHEYELPVFLRRRNQFWKHYNPKFAGSVHNTIVFDSLGDNFNFLQRWYIEGVSLCMDSIGSLSKIYDPRDHFDGGYINEAWELMRERVKDKDSITSFAMAVHSIADFYAHTTYAHFAPIVDGKLVLFDGDVSPFRQQTDYSFLTRKGFTVNESLQPGLTDRQKAVDYCCSQGIISGRFAQEGDDKRRSAEKKLVTLSEQYTSRKDYPEHGLLPHHDEIAVDGLDMPDYHVLYAGQAAEKRWNYEYQFKLRREAAISHITLLYKEWSGK